MSGEQAKYIRSFEGSYSDRSYMPKTEEEFLKEIRENKSAIYPSLQDSLYQSLIWTGWNVLSAYVAISYYMQVAPLANAIDLISQEIKSINPLVYDPKNDRFIDDHPVLQLLKFPNADITFQEFVERFITYYLITGNAYTVAAGPVNRPPLELFIAPPQSVTISQGQDGFTETIIVTNQYQSRVFNRHELKGRFKYFDHNDEAEIYHTRTFNPYWGINQNYGVSKLCAIYYEIEQYILASHHNLSILDKGTKVSGSFVSDSELSDDQFQRLQEQVHSLFMGSNNAGRPVVLQGGVRFEKIEQGRADMDFDQLDKRVTYKIYNQLRIPLPLITTETTAQANMQVAKGNLYHNCIIPLARVMYKEWTDLLMRRYTGSENLILTFDMDDIEALQDLRLEEMTKLKGLDIYTINELRALRGDDPLKGGDVVYRGANQYPAARDETIESIYHPGADEETSPYAAKKIPRLLPNSDISRFKRKNHKKYAKDEVKIEKSANKIILKPGEKLKITMDKIRAKRIHRRRPDNAETLKRCLSGAKTSSGDYVFPSNEIDELVDRYFREQEVYDASSDL